MCASARSLQTRTASSRPKIQSRIRDHSCSRSESPISHIVGGHSPTKRARLSALPRCVWSTVLARIHRPRQRPIVPNEARYRWVLRTPARCNSPITMCVSVFVDSCDHRQAGYSTVSTRITPGSSIGRGIDVVTVAIGRALAVITRWLWGTALVTWRYLWETTPLHRSESVGDEWDR